MGINMIDVSRSVGELAEACNTLTSSVFTTSEALRKFAYSAYVCTGGLEEALRKAKRNLYILKHTKSLRIRKKYMKRCGLLERLLDEDLRRWTEHNDHQKGVKNNG